MGLNNDAFPRPSVFAKDDESFQFSGSDGMSYRQWLAGLMMQAVVQRLGFNLTGDEAVTLALSRVDALIARLEQKEAK